METSVSAKLRWLVRRSVVDPKTPYFSYLLLFFPSVWLIGVPFCANDLLFLWYIWGYELHVCQSHDENATIDARGGGGKELMKVNL